MRKPLIRIFGERETPRGKRPRLTPHDLRRLFKSVGAEFGIDPVILNLRVGLTLDVGVTLPRRRPSQCDFTGAVADMVELDSEFPPKREQHIGHRCFLSTPYMKIPAESAACPACNEQG